MVEVRIPGLKAPLVERVAISSPPDARN
jgi:hypothetical protein